MNNAYRGAIYSGLICPGLGQIIFKRYIRGGMFMAIVFVCLGYIVYEAVQGYLAVLEHMMLHGNVITVMTIVELVTDTSFLEMVNPGMVLWVAFIGSWILSVIDAFLIGRKIDDSEKILTAQK